MSSILCLEPAKYRLQLKGQSDFVVCEQCADKLLQDSKTVPESLYPLSDVDLSLNLQCQNRLEVSSD